MEADFFFDEDDRFDFGVVVLLCPAATADLDFGVRFFAPLLDFFEEEERLPVLPPAEARPPFFSLPLLPFGVANEEEETWAAPFFLHFAAAFFFASSAASRCCCCSFFFAAFAAARLAAAAARYALPPLDASTFRFIDEFQ